MRKPAVSGRQSAAGKEANHPISAVVEKREPGFGRRTRGNLPFGWLIVFTLAAVGWATGAVAQGNPAGSASNGQNSAPIPKALAPYMSCGFPDGLRIVGTSSLGQGPMSRPVQTARGTENIELQAGEQVIFSYPLTDDFANAKVELLPADRYAELKQTLLGNLHFLEHERNGPTAALALPVGLHGFEVHGNDVRKLEGNVLGMYVMFDDPAHVATTIYFLNQHAWARKFQTMDAYGRLRDNFLRTYTGCVRENQALAR